MAVRIKFEPRDLWWGAFVDTQQQRLYVCLLPCFPIIFDLPIVLDEKNE